MCSCFTYFNILSSIINHRSAFSLLYFFLLSFPLCHASCKNFMHIILQSTHSTHTQKHFHLAVLHKQSHTHTHTHPTQHQRESLMSVVEGVETALSANMLISYATEMLHPSAVPEMGHNTATAHQLTWYTDENTRTYLHTHIKTILACNYSCVRANTWQECKNIPSKVTNNNTFAYIAFNTSKSSNFPPPTRCIDTSLTFIQRLTLRDKQTTIHADRWCAKQRAICISGECALCCFIKTDGV